MGSIGTATQTAPKRFSAGTFADGVEDFYYDVQFSTEEEAEQWAISRDLTHIYDSETGKYRRIGGKNWRNA